MGQESKIHLNFVLSKDEFVFGHRAYLRNAMFSIRNLAFLLVGVTLIFAQAQVLDAGVGPLQFLLAFLFGAFLLIAYVYWFLPAKLYERRSKFSSPHHWIIDEKGLTLEGENGESILWEQVTGVLERDSLFLVIRKGYVPVLLPFRAFSLTGSIDNFRSRSDLVRP